MPEPRDRVQDQREERSDRIEVQGLRLRLPAGHDPQAHHFHPQGQLNSIVYGTVFGAIFSARRVSIMSLVFASNNGHSRRGAYVEYDTD